MICFERLDVHLDEYHGRLSPVLWYVYIPITAEAEISFHVKTLKQSLPPERKVSLPLCKALSPLPHHFVLHPLDVSAFPCVAKWVVAMLHPQAPLPTLNNHPPCTAYQDILCLQHPAASVHFALQSYLLLSKCAGRFNRNTLSHRTYS